MKQLRLHWLNFWLKFNRIVEMDSAGLPLNNCATVNMPLRPIWNFIFTLPTILMALSVAIGCYDRYWVFGEFLTLSIMGLSGCLLTLIIGVLRIRTKKPSVLDPIGHLWLGCGIGLIALLNPEVDEDLPLGPEKVLKWLLAVSLSLQFLLDFANQLCCLRRRENLSKKLPEGIFNTAEMCEVMGLSLSCLVLPNEIFWIFVALLCGLLTTALAIRLRSWISLGILAFLVATAYRYTFPSVVHLVTLHPVALMFLCGRLVISGVISLFVSNGVDRLALWQHWLTAKRLWQSAALLTFVGTGVIFFALHADSVKSHREWIIVTPIFTFVSIGWLLIHFIFTAVLMELIGRLAVCKKLLVSGSEAELRKILGAKGLRYFSLVGLRLGYFAIVTTCLIGVLCAAVRNGYNFSLLSIVLALEAVLTELFNEFTTGLGGTCVGYAIVSPVANLRTDGVTLLPPNFLQEAGTRSTRTVNLIVDFFAQHMIVNSGCEWSMGGLYTHDLTGKLQQFFSQTVNDGGKQHRYDTYVLYYSGPVTDVGDFALTNDSSFSLTQLLNVWRECSTISDSRLILLCDTHHSDQWLKGVRSVRSDYVALQTAELKSVGAKKGFFTRHSWNRHMVDMSSGSNDVTSVGDFTQKFVDFNSKADKSADPFNSDNQIRPIYAVSQCWTEFQLRWPVADELRNYWLSSLPRFSHRWVSPMLNCMARQWPSLLTFWCCCGLNGGWLRRCRLRFCPPRQLHIGLGFKLIRH